MEHQEINLLQSRAVLATKEKLAMVKPRILDSLHLSQALLQRETTARTHPSDKASLNKVKLTITKLNQNLQIIDYHQPIRDRQQLINQLENRSKLKLWEL